MKLSLTSILLSFVSSGATTLKFLAIVATMTLNIIIAKFCPTHSRTGTKRHEMLLHPRELLNVVWGLEPAVGEKGRGGREDGRVAVQTKLESQRWYREEDRNP